MGSTRGEKGGDLHDLELVIASRIPIVAVESREELRVVELFRRAAYRQGRPLYQWSVSEGLRRLDGDHSAQRSFQEPGTALGHIRTLTIPGIFLLLDFHPYFQEPLNVRLLREIAQDHDRVARTVVLVSPRVELPDELAHHTARIELSLPSSQELEELVLQEARLWNAENPGKRVQAGSRALSVLKQNLLGLTFADARRLVRNAIYDDGAITESDMSEVMEAKYRLLDQGGVLSFEMDTAGLASLDMKTRLR